jgi:hypothetical protein
VLGKWGTVPPPVETPKAGHEGDAVALPLVGRVIAFEGELGGVVSLRPILRDARLWRAPQDEALFRGEILNPHGEERRLRRVSNHEAEYATGKLLD